MIAVLGTGLLGSGFARAFRKRGEAVHVWNRSPGKAQALEADGCKAFESAAEAVRGATRVHIVLSDDAAVDAVLDAARPGLAPDAIVFDHSTTSTAGARARTARTDLTYLHAPVFMGPGNALEATGLMLVSGDRALVGRVTPLLTPMTGKLVDFGERVDAAAAMKLLGNLLLIAFTAGFADILSLAKAMQIAPAEVATLFTHFNPGKSLETRFARVLAQPYDEPSWALGMARKDAGLMQAEADAAGVPLAMLPAVAARMDEVIAQGFAEADWVVLAKDALPPAGVAK